MVSDKKIGIDKANYYFNKNGSLIKNKWVYDKEFNSWYYLKNDGKYDRSEWIEINQKKYIFNEYGNYMLEY